ncbi:hypothetical protein BDQ17DRAFT_1203676, partial [Cyathus striatus]
RLKSFQLCHTNFLKLITASMNRAINIISERRKYHHAEKKILHDRIQCVGAE